MKPVLRNPILEAEQVEKETHIVNRPPAQAAQRQVQRTQAKPEKKNFAWIALKSDFAGKPRNLYQKTSIAYGGLRYQLRVKTVSSTLVLPI